jgi:hypothetical protein
MFEVENIRAWRGHDVVDVDGHKIGTLEAIYVDTATDQPAFGTVKVGVPTRHRLLFVPLAKATVAPEHVRLPLNKKQVRHAPSIAIDGELPAGEEEAVFAHYDMPYQAAPNHRRLARR